MPLAYEHKALKTSCYYCKFPCKDLDYPYTSVCIKCTTSIRNTGCGFYIRSGTSFDEDEFKKFQKKYEINLSLEAKIRSAKRARNLSKFISLMRQKARLYLLAKLPFPEDILKHEIAPYI